MGERSSIHFRKNPEQILGGQKIRKEPKEKGGVAEKGRSSTVYKNPEFYDETGQPKPVVGVDLVSPARNYRHVQIGRQIEDIDTDVEEGVGEGVNGGVDVDLESSVEKDGRVQIEQRSEGMRKAAAREIESGYGVRERRQDASKWRGKGKKLNKPSRGGKEEEFRKVA